ncbi:DUF1648 domain-containing protein [Leekyejoonella antrihumi]|uniref:DUF1648 domain-containing protein n=1 Tax=Leekyejoonella antrihumi TaxID=1660198 RepID=A0A563E309_9MICO|nr:DUF1648 domain-containing protein [Leekyejoonella antrihumi]TWP36918.1 DUF1648 domain-containing protein [Leekyejoonella antrihumi]
MKWFAVGLVLVLGGCLWLTPVMSRRTVPLGVAVPSDKVDDPVVRRAIGRFRKLVVAASVLVAGLVVALGADSTMAIAPLAVVLLAAAAFVWARQPILRAKARQGWYDQVPVRLRGAVTSDTEPKRWTSRVEIGWYAASLVLLLGSAAAGAVRYDSLPARIPTHFTFAGTPDQYADKSMISVFGPLIGGVGVIVLLLGLMGVTFVAPERQYPDGDPDHAGERARRKRAFVTRALGVIALVGCATICGACLAIYFRVTSWALTPVLVSGMVLILAVVGWAVLRAIGLQRPGAGSSGRSAESPDDDRYWKAGLIYVNREDPALFVPKRQGIGYTINLGHRAGQIVTGLVLLIVVVTVVSSVVGH